MKRTLFSIGFSLFLSTTLNATITYWYPDSIKTDYAHDSVAYGIWYRTNEPHNHQLKKPMLIVSGFDPSSVIRIGVDDVETPRESDKVFLYRVANKDGFLDQLRANGYDIVAYRCKKSMSSLSANGSTLIRFIKQEVAARTPPEAQIVVVGASMGGLLVRYALTKMEHDGDPHKVSLFISLDSPQEGANIPLGFQYLVSSLNSNITGYLIAKVSDQLKAGQEMLDCDAAQEMLLYHHVGTLLDSAKPSPKRDAFLRKLQSYGHFPRQCRSLAISQGSGTGGTQGFADGASVLRKNATSMTGQALSGAISTAGIAVATAELLSGGLMPFGTSTIIGTGGLVFADGLNITLDFDMHAASNFHSQTIYHERIGYSICTWGPVPKPSILLPLWFEFENICKPIDPAFKTVNINVCNLPPLDNAPGSRKGLHNLSDFGLNVDGLFNWLGGLDIAYKEPNFDSFILSYSSLGLRDLADKPHTHIINYLDRQSNISHIKAIKTSGRNVSNKYFFKNSDRTKTTNFDYLYIEEKNLPHIYDDNKEGCLTPGMLNAMNDLLPLEVFNNSGKNNLRCDEDDLRVQILGGRCTDSRAELQVSVDSGKSWQVLLASVQAQDEPNCSYDEFTSKTCAGFADFMGKNLQFKVVKTLNSESMISRVLSGIRFVPSDFPHTMKELRRTTCDTLSTFEVYLGNKADAKYITLPQNSGNRYSWIMTGTAGVTYLCNAVMESGNKAIFTPPAEVFEQPTDQTYTLALRDNATQETYCASTVAIPRRPRAITVAQREASYEINGVKYTMPDTLNKFVVLNINDSDYVTHHRVPYVLEDESGNRIATISEMGISDFDSLPAAQQDALRASFDSHYNRNLKNNRSAQLEFARMQQGLVTVGEVDEIAMPADSFFFVYAKGAELYKVYLSGKDTLSRQQLFTASAKVHHLEITPDGAYCVYQKDKPIKL